MLYSDDIINMKIYKKPFILPLNMKTKKFGSSVLLLTPNYQSTVQTLKNPLLVPRYYNSYYIEKDISLYISNESNEAFSNTEEPDEIIIQEKAKTTMYYSGSSYDVGYISRTIPAVYYEEITSKYKVDIRKSVSIVCHPLIPSDVPKCTDKYINVSSRSYFDVPDKKYDNYLKACMVKSIILNINPDVDNTLIDGICYYETGHSFSSNAKDASKMVKACIDKYGINKLISIIKKNRWTDFSEFVIPLAVKDLKKIFAVKEALDIPDAASIARRIKRRSRKSIYAHNQLKKNTDSQIPTISAPDVSPSAGTNTSSDNKSTSDEEKEEPLTEATTFSELNFKDEVEICENYIKVDDQLLLNEADNEIIKKLLWKERLRTNKDVLSIYDALKTDVDYINYTFFSYQRYLKKNLFIDFSFYNKTFFKNNIYKLDRATNLYAEFIGRLINDKRINEAGYNNKFIIVPVKDWDLNPSTKMWMYTQDINPISVFVRLLNTNMDLIKEKFKDVNFLFLSDKAYFKADFSKFQKEDISKFIYFIKKLRDGNIQDVEDIEQDSPTAISINIIDKIEKSKGIQINNISAINKTSVTATKNIKIKPTETEELPPSKLNKEIEKDKDELVASIAKAASISADENETMETMDEEDRIKEIIMALSAEEGKDAGINNARQSRIIKMKDELLEKEIQGKSIKDMLEETKDNKPLQVTSLNIDTVNEEFKNLTYTNMDKSYDINDALVSMLYAFSEKTMPVTPRDIKVEDTSTSEDFIDTYTVAMEDAKGKRFSLVFDVPKFKNDRYMILRGNKKNISNQLFLMPVIKTDIDTAQIVSNYKKIFIRTFGTTAGKSFVTVSKIMKVLSKGNVKSISYLNGDNTRICNKYELPIDYIDFAGSYSFIEMDSAIGHYTFYFNQDKIREDYPDIDETKGIPVCIYKDIHSNKTCLYYDGEIPFSNYLHEILRGCKDSETYIDEFNKTSQSVRYTYSKASILNTKIPLVIVCAYSEGLTKVMKKANIKFEILEKRPKYDPLYQDLIKFSDGYILYDLDYNSSLLMNGLKAVDTTKYSLTDINSKMMYVEMLDLFGSRLLADGLDNFYDLMIDPITVETLKKYKLPEDYVGVLLHANKLLADNKYVKHTDATGRRLRHKELIAACAYDVLSRSYGEYRTALKRGKDVPMTIKKSAVIDRVMSEPTMADLSILNPLLELEAYNSVSTKGISGLNSDRSYSLDKRGYDDSMYGVIGMSTGFAGNVGITRQLTIDANIDGSYGYVKPGTKDDAMSVTKSLAATEALTPFGSNHDDPFRTAMTFIQTSKHSLRTVNSDPLLISNGADEALPYLISDAFAFKAKADGSVVYKDDKTMIVEYKDGTKDYINLEETTEKNSSGGFFVTIKLSTDLKVGNRVKTNDILAYDKTAFSSKVGAYDNIAYNIGKLTKIAILNTDEGYEDSTYISEKLSHDLSSEQVLCKDIKLDKESSVFNLVEIGQHVEEGDPLLIIQSSYDEEDSNRLVKNLMADNENDITELGRRSIKAPITGEVQNIIIYRTCELEDLSPSLQKLVKKYESGIKAKKKVLEQYGIKDNTNLPADYALPNVGKLKTVIEGVLIEVYVKYLDKFSIGDKLINYSALKGVCKDIMPVGLEPKSEFNPNENINILLAVQSVNGRMVCSIIFNASINKFLIELDRENKKTLGLPINYDI